MLHPSSLACLLCLPVFCWEYVNKLRLQYEGAPKYLGKSVTYAKIWNKEETKMFRCICSIWGSSMDASGCTDEWQWFWCACTVVSPLENQSRWSWCHFMTSQRSLMLLREGTINKEHNWTLGLLSGSSGTKYSGLLTSHRPSTSAVLVPLMEKSIPRMECVTCLCICMYPDLSGELSG